MSLRCTSGAREESPQPSIACARWGRSACTAGGWPQGVLSAAHRSNAHREQTANPTSPHNAWHCQILRTPAFSLVVSRSVRSRDIHRRGAATLGACGAHAMHALRAHSELLTPYLHGPAPWQTAKQKLNSAIIFIVGKLAKAERHWVSVVAHFHQSHAPSAHGSMGCFSAPRIPHFQSSTLHTKVPQTPATV